MDPELMKAILEYRQKSAALKQQGVTVNPQQVEEFFRARTNGKFGAGDAEKLLGSATSMGGYTGLANVGRAVKQGATFGFSDEMAGPEGSPEREGERLQQNTFAKAHPIVNGLSEFVGGLAAPAAVAAAAPEAMGGAAMGVPARTILSGLFGAGGAAAGAAGHATEGNRLDAAKRAAPVGLGLGLLLPGVSAATDATADGALDAFSANRAVTRVGGANLPPDAAEIFAKREALAPGTTVPGALSPRMAGTTAVAGADPTAAYASEASLTQRLSDIRKARQSLGQGYDDLDRRIGPLPVDPTLEAISHQASDISSSLPQLYTQSKVRLQEVRDLASEVDRLAGDPESSALKSVKLREVGNMIQAWLEKTVGAPLQELNTKYGVLRSAQDDTQKALEVVRSSGDSYGRNAMAGLGTGSAGGKISKVGALTDRIMDVIGNRTARAGAVNKQLLQPGGQTMPALLQARQAALEAKAAPSAGVMAAAPAGDAITALLRLWQTQPLPQGGQPTQ